MAEIYLLRHGTSELQGKFVGRTDCGLSVQGRAEVQLLSEKLKGINFDRIYCSPLLRCRQTYKLLELDCQVIFDHRIKEIDFGRWENLDFQEMIDQDQERVNRWLDSPMTFTFPNGENVGAFSVRICDFIEDLVEDKEDQKLLIITHGGVIRFLLCKLLGFSLEKYHKFNPLPGCYSIVSVFPQGAALMGFNLR